MVVIFKIYYYKNVLMKKIKTIYISTEKIMYNEKLVSEMQERSERITQQLKKIKKLQKELVSLEKEINNLEKYYYWDRIKDVDSLKNDDNYYPILDQDTIREILQEYYEIRIKILKHISKTL